MGNNAMSWVAANPAFYEPELLLQYSQASGAFDTLCKDSNGKRGIRAKLSEGDLYTYIRRVDLRTKSSANQGSNNLVPSVEVVTSLISTPTYLLQVRADYDHLDVAAMGRQNISLPEAQRLGMRQAQFQLSRNALLYGFNPAAGEGLLNAAGSVHTTLPADSNGNTTVVTYDNGQMAFLFMQIVQQIKARTVQLGIGQTITIVGPQRVLGLLEYNVVQLVQFQRVGAGTTSTAGTVKSVLMDNGDEVIWAYDDTLIGKGANGTDAILFVMPEVEKPEGDEVNTNEFAKVSPGLTACTLMYSDMAAPREIISPLPGGATDVLMHWRNTSGWGVRPEAITVLSAQYQ